MAKREARVELKGSTRAAVPGSQDVGPADPSQQIEVSVLLRRPSRPRKFPSVAKIGATSLAKRKYLSREEFAQSYGASADDLEKIRAFAERYGLTVVSENPAMRTVKLSGTVDNFNKAFEVDLRRYEHSSGGYRGRTGAMTIPKALGKIVQGVFGLDDRQQAKPHFRLKKNSVSAAQVAATSYSPVQVAEAYSFPTSVNGAGQCIAVIELGGGYNINDLNTFFGNLGITPAQVTSVSVDGASNSPSGNPSSADGEVELDLEVA